MFTNLLVHYLTLQCLIGGCSMPTAIDLLVDEVGRLHFLIQYLLIFIFILLPYCE